MNRMHILILFLLYSSRNAVAKTWKSFRSGEDAPSKSTLISGALYAGAELSDIMKELMSIYKAEEGAEPKQSSQPPRLIPGYDEYSGVGQYKFHPELLTWFEARMACIAEGGHLAVANSEEEAKVLAKIFATEMEKWDTPMDYFFVGFHDLYNEGEYTTIFDAPINDTGYERWKKGEPNNRSRFSLSEDCGGMDSEGLLSDIHCSREKSPFICENS